MTTERKMDVFDDFLSIAKTIQDYITPNKPGAQVVILNMFPLKV